MLYCSVLCCTVLCCAVLGCTGLYCVVLCCTVLYCAVLCCTVLYCAVLFCAGLYCAVLCCTVLYCAVLCFTWLACHPTQLQPIRSKLVGPACQPTQNLANQEEDSWASLPAHTKFSQSENDMCQISANKDETWDDYKGKKAYQCCSVAT